MDINIGLSTKNRNEIIDLLNGILADTHVLYIKTRNFHWNVTGPDFSEMHKFFESQYVLLEPSIDEIAERVRSLGGVALGSMGEFLKASSLKEDIGALKTSKPMVTALLKDHEAVITNLRKAVNVTADKGDTGTSDFLTGLMESHEKMAWMLRSSL